METNGIFGKRGEIDLTLFNGGISLWRTDSTSRDYDFIGCKELIDLSKPFHFNALGNNAAFKYNVFGCRIC